MSVGYSTGGIMKFIEYTSKIDSKKRITIRNPKYDYYVVKEYENGLILLEPKELVKTIEISENTLKMMDKSIKNIKILSKPVDI